MRKKREGKVTREGKRPNGHFIEYTPLAMSKEKILVEITMADLTEASVKPPKAPSQERKGVDKTKYCRFHKCHGHVTDDCIHLKDAIELLIQRRQLKQFIKSPESERNIVEVIDDGTETGKIITMFVQHLGDSTDNVEITPYSCTWEQFPSANVITGGTPNISMGSMKRKFEEPMSVNLMAPSNHGGRPPLAFYDSELPGGALNSAIPLLVRASMANTDVRRVLIDTKASCDIMYTALFKTLQLTEKNLSPYVGNVLYVFNGSSTQPWGYMELLITFGEKEAKKTIRIPFLVIGCPSLYNCIIGRTGLAQLGATCSTSHLKLKYHAKDGIIASLNGDIEAARRCFLQANKAQNLVSQPSKPAENKGKAAASTLDANLVELDPRFTKEDLKEQKREKKDPFNAKLLRPIPDGEFELIPFENDPLEKLQDRQGSSRTCQSTADRLPQREHTPIRLERGRHARNRP